MAIRIGKIWEPATGRVPRDRPGLFIPTVTAILASVLGGVIGGVYTQRSTAEAINAQNAQLLQQIEAQRSDIERQIKAQSDQIGNENRRVAYSSFLDSIDDYATHIVLSNDCQILTGSGISDADCAEGGQSQRWFAIRQTENRVSIYGSTQVRSTARKVFDVVDRLHSAYTEWRCFELGACKETRFGMKDDTRAGSFRRFRDELAVFDMSFEEARTSYVRSVCEEMEGLCAPNWPTPIAAATR